MDMLQTKIDKNSREYKTNYADMTVLMDNLRLKLDRGIKVVANAGGLNPLGLAEHLGYT